MGERPYTASVVGTFGERVRALRTQRAMTLSELARRVEVTEGAIRQMESGQTKSASLVVGLRLARLFEVSPWFLATGRDAPAESGSRSEADLLAALERLSLRISALDQRVSSLEGPAGGGPRRKAPKS